MMGPRQVAQGALFYEFSLEDHVPADHLLRSVDRFVGLSGVRSHLAPFYSAIGRPSIDPELMIRMLLVGYVMGIRSERRLCEEVHLNLAYRWFCRLDLSDPVPDHSTFSKNRHGRFRESDLLRHLFETVVARCITEGLVGGNVFAADASLIRADANKQNSTAREDWDPTSLDPEEAPRAVREYLEVLDDAAFGAASEVDPKFTSHSDPAAQWTGAMKGPNVGASPPFAGANMCARRFWRSSSPPCLASSGSTTRFWSGCARRCTPAMRMNATSTRRRSSGSRPSTDGSASASARCISTSLTERLMAIVFDKMAGQWREEQWRLQHDIERHEEAEQSYMDEGVRILELACNAQALFEGQPACEKRRLLNFVLSNCSWEDGEIVATFRQPFDLLAETTAIAARSSAESGLNSTPFLNAYRTMCIAPEAEFRQLLQEIRTST